MEDVDEAQKEAFNFNNFNKLPLQFIKVIPQFLVNSHDSAQFP